MVGIFILFSSPSLSHSLRRPSLSTDSTSRPSLSCRLFLSYSIYLAVLMFYLYHLMFYLNIFYFFLYVVLNLLFFIFYIYVVVVVFLIKLTGYELMI
jgi:hypothetical protein